MVSRDEPDHDELRRLGRSKVRIPTAYSTKEAKEGGGRRRGRTTNFQSEAYHRITKTFPISQLPLESLDFMPLNTLTGGQDIFKSPKDHHHQQHHHHPPSSSSASHDDVFDLGRAHSMDKKKKFIEQAMKCNSNPLSVNNMMGFKNSKEVIDSRIVTFDEAFGKFKTPPPPPPPPNNNNNEENIQSCELGLVNNSNPPSPLIARQGSSSKYYNNRERKSTRPGHEPSIHNISDDEDFKNKSEKSNDKRDEKGINLTNVQRILFPEDSNLPESTGKSSEWGTDLEITIQASLIQMGEFVQMIGRNFTSITLILSTKGECKLSYSNAQELTLIEAPFDMEKIDKIQGFCDSKEGYLDFRFLEIPQSYIKNVLYLKDPGRASVMRVNYNTEVNPTITNDLLEETFFKDKFSLLSRKTEYRPEFDFGSCYRNPEEQEQLRAKSNEFHNSRLVVEGEGEEKEENSSGSHLDFKMKNDFVKHNFRFSKRSSPSMPQMDPSPRLLFTYPPNDSNAISITSNELLRLSEGVYLNDSLIELDLRLIFERVPKEIRSRTHIFSSFFFKKLLRKSEANSFTIKLNIFEKSFVFVPINEHMHWYLALILEPSSLLNNAHYYDENNEGERSNPFSSSSNNGDPSLNGDPDANSNPNVNDLYYQLQDTGDKSSLPSTASNRIHILIFDSLGCKSRRLTVERLKSFIIEEAKRKQNLLISKKSIGALYPRVPLQSNLTDCGCFLLEYVERFLESPGKVTKRIIEREDLSKWFNPDDAALRRVKLREVIDLFQTSYQELERLPLDNYKNSQWMMHPSSASSDIEEILPKDISPIT